MINLYVIVNLRPSWPALGLFVMTCTMCCCPPIYMEKLYRFTWTNSVCLFIFQNDEVVCDQTAEWASYKRWKCRYRLFVLPSARYFTIIVEKFHFLTPGKSLEKCWGFWGSFCLIGRCGEKLAGNKQREIDHSIWCNGAFRKTSIVRTATKKFKMWSTFMNADWKYEKLAWKITGTTFAKTNIDLNGLKLGNCEFYIFFYFICVFDSFF